MQSDENLNQQAIKNLQAILEENSRLQQDFKIAYNVWKTTEEKLQQAQAEIKRLKSKKPLPAPIFKFMVN